MNLIKALFSSKSAIRGLKISLGIMIVYLVTAWALALWPSSLPFENQKPRSDERHYSEIEQGGIHTSQNEIEDIAIATKAGDALFARQFRSDRPTTIVLMHGIAADSGVMFEAARSLREATGASVITPDFRGHGRSAGDKYDIDYIGQYEDDLEDIIHFVKKEYPQSRIIVAGHSMGGGVAMRYALKEDAPVPDAYLLFAPNFGEGPTQRTEQVSNEISTEEVAPPVYFDVRRMIGIIMLNTVAIHALDHLPIMYFNFPPQRKDYSYRSIMSAQPIRPNTSDIALQAVRSPLLVVIGSNDEVFEVNNYESFVSTYSDGETVVISGPDHNSLLSDPKAYDVVRQWYEKLH